MRTPRTPVLAATALAALSFAGPLAAQSIPTPASVLGFEVGADFHLATYDESIEYFRRLEQASDRIRLVEIGRTSEGRPWYMSLVSSPENLARIEELRSIVQRLAHPTGLSEAEARRLATEGKSFVHIDGGLHASEVAGAQHTIEMAHRLVHGADTSARIAAMLEETVVLLWPSLNPDGQNIVVDWYRSNLGTPFEVAPLVQLYQKYIGHDNNRDAYMLNMIESRVVTRTWRHWEPHIIYVHHQTAPFPTRIWLPPFAEPIATQAPPLMSRTVNTIGMTIAQALEANGQAGATHMGTGFDAWYPGYIDYMPMLQNIAAFWTETALYRYATPHFYTVSDFPQSRRDLRPQTLYSSPWEGGWWRLRDAVDYMVTASLAVIDYAAKYREDLLYNRYQAGRNTIRTYETAPPYAYVVPVEQGDPVTAVALLRRLAFNGLRINRVTNDVTVGNTRYAAGSWVIPMDQEFAELARQLLDVQTYPDLREFPDGPPEQPYDAAGWTLSEQMGVRVVALMDPLGEELVRNMEPVRGAAVPWDAEGDASPFDIVPGVGLDTDSVAAGIVPPAGSLTGSGANVAISPRQNNTFRLVGRAMRAGATVRFQSDGTRGGEYVVSDVSRALVAAWADSLALQARRVGGAGGPVVRQRIGLFRPWTASMDEGWTRWLFERYEIDFTNLRTADMRAGALGARFDVIVVTDERTGAILDGHAMGTVPPRYAGGIGAEGVRALDRFVRGGGTLVCLNRCAAFAIEHLGLPVENAVGELGRDEFFFSSSIVEVEVDTAHPVAAGMSPRSRVFVDRSPAFTTKEGFEGRAIAKYQAAGSPLVSGYLLGEEHIAGHAAALDVKHGDGHVILFGFRPQWRGLTFATFRLLFNAVLYGDALARADLGTDGFWTPPARAVEADSTGGR